MFKPRMDANIREWLQRSSVGSSRMTIRPFRALESRHEDKWFSGDFLTLFAFIRGSDLFSINAPKVVAVPIRTHLVFARSDRLDSLLPGSPSHHPRLIPGSVFLPDMECQTRP